MRRSVFDVDKRAPVKVGVCGIDASAHWDPSASGVLSMNAMMPSHMGWRTRCVTAITTLRGQAAQELSRVEDGDAAEHAQVRQMAISAHDAVRLAFDGAGQELDVIRIGQNGRVYRSVTCYPEP